MHDYGFCLPLLGSYKLRSSSRAGTHFACNEIRYVCPWSLWPWRPTVQFLQQELNPVYVYTRIYTCIYIYLYAYTYLYIHKVFLSLYIYINECTCIYVYIYIYIHMRCAQIRHRAFFRGCAYWGRGSGGSGAPPRDIGRMIW